MDTLLGSLIQSCCGEGGTLQTNITGICGECSQCLGHSGFAPCSLHVCFPCLHCLGSRLLCRELSEASPGCMHFPGLTHSGSRLLRREPPEAGPGLHAPPRSKPLRFRHSGSPQRCRLGWACVLCSSQFRAAQVMRCLASVMLRLIASPPLGYLGVKPAHLLRQMLTVQTPKKF